jgi:hypothetical protein
MKAFAFSGLCILLAPAADAIRRRASTNVVESAPGKKVRFEFEQGADIGDGRCGPDGVALEVKPLWTEYMETCGSSSGPSAVTKFQSCPTDKPYLHFTETRYCCKAVPHNHNQCCDLIGTVNYGIQQVRLHQNAIDQLSGHARQMYRNYVATPERELSYWKRGWKNVCPAGTFAETEPVDDTPPKQSLKDWVISWVAWCQGS